MCISSIAGRVEYTVGQCLQTNTKHRCRSLRCSAPSKLTAACPCTPAQTLLTVQCKYDMKQRQSKQTSSPHMLVPVAACITWSAVWQMHCARTCTMSCQHHYVIKKVRDCLQLLMASHQELWSVTCHMGSGYHMVLPATCDR